MWVFILKIFLQIKIILIISTEHKFQLLTESNKPSKSFRTGLYLTKVQKKDSEIDFNLLRCSTNFNGPTENFKKIDEEIVDKVNNISRYFFKDSHSLNHVLAQIYENVKNDNGKEKKAKIKEHSDKTKDMPTNGLIAFCTFYKDLSQNPSRIVDISQKSKDPLKISDSVLTQIRFRLKKCVSDNNLKDFNVILYPNSVFILTK